MCHPASFVLTKDREFWSLSTDSHTEIIAEHSLHEDGVRGVNVLKVEITPPDGDFVAPLENWRYKIDQDAMPTWHDLAVDEARARKALEGWAAARICRPGGVTVVTGKTVAFACGDSRVEARDSSSVEARDSSSVEARDSSSVVAWDSSSVEARDSSSVVAWDSSSVEARGSSSVVAWDSSSVEARDSSSVEARDSSSVVAWDSSSVEARGSSSVVAWDSSSVEARGSSSVVARDSSSVVARGSSRVVARDSSRVVVCKSHSTARIYGSSEPPKPEGAYAVVIDCRGDKAIAVVGT